MPSPLKQKATHPKNYESEKVARVDAIHACASTIAPKYDIENNWEVLFRLNGSVWSNVLPWCLFNTAMAAGIYYSDDKYRDLVSSNDRGHAFMSLCVSYLLVTRSNICLNRYMAQRANLSNLMRASKELVHHAVAFTRHHHREEKDTKWRCSVAKRTISILKVVVSVLQFPTSKRNVWEVAELGKEDRQACLLAVGRSNERSPLVLTLFLRTVIASHIHQLSSALQVPHEMALFQYTTEIMEAYSNIMVYMSTPYPFPFVQMLRTILFFYVLTLPFALVNDIEQLVPYLFTVFLITYGFIGLELISIEMDDPFGDDPNDFNVDALARVTYKDIIVTIRDVDGKEAASKVRKSIKAELMAEIKNAVAQHTNYTRVPLWGDEYISME
jgi:predicted membrane chloride channel (bestrophin family)